MPTNEMMDRCHAGGEGEDVTGMSACYVCCQGVALYKSYETLHGLTKGGGCPSFRVTSTFMFL